MKFAAIFAILIGIGMTAQWAMSYLTGQIPELKTEPWRIAFHLAGEMLTAVCLIVGGAGLLSGQGWAPAVYLVATGMLLYTVIVSPGYFAQKGQFIWLVIFGMLAVLALFSAFLVGCILAC